MEYKESSNLDQSRVRYGGGGGRRGPGIAVGGGVGGLIVVILLVLLGGGNIGDIIGMGDQGQQPQQQGTEGQPDCSGDVNIDENRDCRWVAYDNALYNYWSEQLGDQFEPARQQIFSGQISTACGTGSTEMGPFYCPGDDTIYLDDVYMGQLLNELGARGGDAAEFYIVAHEYGHHIQNLTGDLQRGRQGAQSGPDSGQVRLELQADCYAGIIFYHTEQDPDSAIEAITEDDLLRITESAVAVGDDHIQERSGGRVVPESWTHGSSEMRKRWVTKGFETGDPAQCNSLDVPAEDL